MFSRAITNHLKRHSQKLTAQKFEVCPKCGYNSLDADNPTSLPEGINPSILLDASPSPQLLLSENGVIIHANKCAARVLRVKQMDEPEEEEKNPTTEGEEHWIPPEYYARRDGNTNEEGPEKPHATGLEGHTLDQLNILLADPDIRPWVNLMQVFEHIKIKLHRQEAAKNGTDASERAEMYGEGPKYSSYDYYGERENLKRGDGVHADLAARDTAPVCIERDDGKEIPATMFVALIDPFHTGFCYSTVTFIPGLLDGDATFTTQTAIEGGRRRRRKRDILKRMKHHKADEKKPIDPGDPVRNKAAGKSGLDMMQRVARIKDQVLDQMDYCFIALSPDGDIVITNAATKAILGRETLKASIGEGFDWIARLDIWRPDFSERLPFEEWALTKLITHRKPLTQVIGLYAGTMPLVVELRGKCLYEDPEKEEGLLAALAIVVDQTQWFSKEKHMTDVQTRQELFISAISRELKTPVAGILGLLELLYGTGDKLNEEQLDYIRQIFGTLNSQMLVIQDIIDFNKINAGELAIDRRTFILQDLVEELETLFSGSMAKAGIHFEIDTSGIDESVFGDGSRLVLVGDDSKIRRIAVNMLSNAFKFAVKGEVRLKVVTQKVMRNSLEVKFEIQDTGLGISDEDRQRLFAPFDEKQESKTIGVDGIGLNIARKFVSLLAGDIGCMSIVGRGTTFWFTVPCGRPSPESKVEFGPKEMTLSKTLGIVLHSKDLEEGKGQVASGLAKVHIEGTVVLLVEDNWAHQMVMARRLQLMGCEVVTALNGRDAIHILKKKDTHVDLIFMDIQMPLLNGFEATKVIRTDPEMARWKNLPIIGVTATEESGFREKAKEYGLNEFTVKPLNNEVTRKFIEGMMDPVAVGKRRGTVG